jgi:hypothetical protein
VCALAKKFLCHVFYTEDRALAKHIVASMASGFDRTLSAAWKLTITTNTPTSIKRAAM